MKQTCSACRFVEHNEYTNSGRCHRCPPPWPFVSPRDWCGEWKSKDDTGADSPSDRSRSEEGKANAGSKKRSLRKRDDLFPKET